MIGFDAKCPKGYCSQVSKRSLLSEVKDLALLLTRSFAALMMTSALRMTSAFRINTYPFNSL
jgi:hypothetical protein